MRDQESVLRLHQAWSFVEQADRVELWSFPGGRRLQLRGDLRIGRLMSALQRGVPSAGAHEALANASGLGLGAVRRLVAQLQSAEVLLEGTPLTERTGRDRETFDPQVEFFGAFESSSVGADDYQKRLAAASVLLAGLGGLGSWIALLLSRVGLGTLIAVDSDTVEFSNLSRQVLFSHDDALAGRAKIDAARPMLSAANPKLNYVGLRRHVTGPSDLDPYLSTAHLAVIPLTYMGRHRFRDTMARACVKAGVPFLVAGSHAVGPLCIPGITPCFACAVEDPRFVRPSQESSESGTRQAMFVREYRFAPWLAMAAARTVDELVRYLTGYADPLTREGLVVSDPMQATSTRIGAAIDPLCQICGPSLKKAGTEKE